MRKKSICGGRENLASSSKKDQIDAVFLQRRHSVSQQVQNQDRNWKKLNPVMAFSMHLLESNPIIV